MSGEWLFGYGLSFEENMDGPGSHYVHNASGWFIIDPDTIGQLVDGFPSKGKVYEGDICVGRNYPMRATDKYFGVISYEEGQYVMEEWQVERYVLFMENVQACIGRCLRKEEHDTIAWLSGLDGSTIDSILSLIKSVKGG